ncbi:MAG TPA: alkaline phosphatase family protein [Terriglobales bacterium]|nr:alkaline phosphatase family protein [Terriglobales bacterium]
MSRILSAALGAAFLVAFLSGPPIVLADGPLHNVNHIIVIMQENHSFDNYFGALAFAPGSPYHNGNGACGRGDHTCVDGLSCTVDGAGNFTCSNSNVDNEGGTVFSFHDSRRCVLPDLDHGWVSTHKEANFLNPNKSLNKYLADGFVRVNEVTEGNRDQTMNFYNQNEIPFYYDLASKFAVSDRYFASVLGPTFPNRSYLLAATSFGHLTTSDTFAPGDGYQPITGTILDLFDQNGVTWADYFQDAPQGAIFRPFSSKKVDPHFFPLPLFLAQVAGAPGVPPLAQVSFVDPNFGLFGISGENDEHPPTDIQRGQAYVSQVVNAVRNGPYWKDSIILITYDEHGGSYDHVKPPKAQDGIRTPDGIFPGQCADLSNPPASLQPGGGAECSTNFINPADNSVQDAENLCPDLAADPTGPFPAHCAAFEQLGIRVPFIAISPFSKPQYVSHLVGDHTSVLALIERRFLKTASGELHLTLRDQKANDLTDMFDFTNSPSLNTPLTQAGPPVVDCTPQ